MNQLQKNGVKVLHEIKRTNFGKMSQIEDPAGNTVELWEPFDTEYTCMVRQEMLNSIHRNSKPIHSVIGILSLSQTMQYEKWHPSMHTLRC